MKRKFVGVIILCLSIVFGGCNTPKINEQSKELEVEKVALKDEKKAAKIKNIEYKEDGLNRYIIDVEVFEDTNSYKANQKLSYINKEDVDLSEIYFHIYPKAFEKEETAPSLYNNKEVSYPNGFNSSKFELIEIKINGENTAYEIIGDTNTILKLNLKDKLKPNERVDISMKYEVEMPFMRGRFGVGEKSINFGNWYPIVAVYDEKDGWNLDPYYSIGDPFYSDISNYYVNITVPKGNKVASTGKKVSHKRSNGKRIFNIEAEKVRDFAFVISKHFKIKVERINEIKILSYVYSGDEDTEKTNKMAKLFSANAMSIFNEKFGKYPYDTLSVVATSFPTGMEYPGIVFISDKLYNNKNISLLETTIVHEIAHQWWYGLVGNNQIDEAWLDEALAKYSEIIYAGALIEGERLEKFKKYILKNYNTMKEDYKGKSSVKGLKEFENNKEYSFLVYSKGAYFLELLSKEYGKDKVIEILKTYYERYKFKTATTEDFKAVCEEVLEKNLDELFNKWVYGEKQAKH